MILEIDQAPSYLPWVWFWSWSTSKATIEIHTGQYVIYSFLQVYSIQMTLNNIDDKKEKKITTEYEPYTNPRKIFLQAQE